MRDHKPSCAVHGRGHRTTRNDALAAWTHAGLPTTACAIGNPAPKLLLTVCQ